jgi:hypothetical protein
MSISGYVTKGIDVIVGIIVLFLLYANLIPEAQSAGDDLNASGVHEYKREFVSAQL